MERALDARVNFLDTADSYVVGKKVGLTTRQFSQHVQVNLQFNAETHSLSE